MTALRARCSDVILVIAVLLIARACHLVLLADAGCLRQEDLKKRSQLRPEIGLQVRNRRSLLKQIPLDCVSRSASPAPLRRDDSRRHEARSASTRARTSPKLSIESRGAETSWWEASVGSVIQTGRSARVRSGWRTMR